MKSELEIGRIRTPDEWSNWIYHNCDSPIMGRSMVPVEIIKKIQSDALNQWQPISSAPKDGTLVLLFGEGNQGQYIKSGFYDEAPRIGSDINWHWGLTFEPTHWMKLPSPPEL